MIPQDQIDAAKSYPLRSLIEREFPLQRDGRLYKARCPFHDEASPSFKIYPDGHAHCFGCGKHVNDAIHYLQLTRHLTFAEAVAELTGSRPSGTKGASRNGARQSEDLTFLPNLAARNAEPPFSCDARPAHAGGSIAPGSRSQDRDSLPYIQKLWDGADNPRLAELYLWSRGINLRPKPLPWAIRGHNEAWCAETRKKRSATLAALQDASGAVVAVQRIWCERGMELPDGVPAKGTRSHLSTPKTTLGRMGSAAVRLAEPRGTLGLAEGVESALAAAQLFSVPTWAVCGASRLGSIDVPESVNHIIIFGDGGKAGSECAVKACSFYRSKGYRVDMEFPPAGVDDWNSYLRESF